MIQLSFQPAFDPHHAIFRILRLRPAISAASRLHRDQIRILDFYLLFPLRLTSFRFSTQHRKYRRLIGHFESTKPYGEQPDDNILFHRMAPMQSAALETLEAKGYLQRTDNDDGYFENTQANGPTGLEEKIDASNREDRELLEFLVVMAREYSLLGEDGLKARSKLLEYRYDSL